MEPELSDVDLHLLHRRQRAEYDAWAAKINKKLPRIAAHVYALRGSSKRYVPLEALLGQVILSINMPIRHPIGSAAGIGEVVINELLVEELFKKVRNLRRRAARQKK